MRVFHDRLVSNEDKDMLIAECVRIGNTFFAVAHKEVESADAPKKEEH